LKLPIAHPTQALALVGVKYPGPHVMQVLAWRLLEYVPWAHKTQELDWIVA
jgi:hypothetical protein